MQKEKFVAIVGPTGVGKTEIAILLHKEIPSEIISCDSRQIYKYLDIGTAKPDKKIRDKIKHHLIDIVLPDDDFTVFDFKTKAEKIITELNKENILPVVVGGTGLYLRAIIEDLSLCGTKGDKNIRDKLQEEKDKFGQEYIYKKLYQIDEASAKKISSQDTKRIIRALEVFYLTGKKFSEYQKQNKVSKYDYLVFGISMQREKLYQKINERVDKMMENGLVDEVKYILSKGYHKNLNSLQTIGYKEIIDYLEGRISLKDAILKIKKETRNYAKRQLTFFRGMKDIIWFDAEDGKEKIVKNMKLIISKKFAYS